jgi:single-strand DNA-binding protein
MTDSLSIRGFVATIPNHLTTEEGLPITTFRLASTRRRFNRESKTWENGPTNWFTVSAYRQLASNVAGCVAKGDPVLVTGRLSVREWENGDRSGIVVEIDADAIGHDLAWGSSRFSRSIKRSAGDGDDEGQAGGPDADAADDSPGGDA